MKHTLKEWIATTRYWSFSVSALPAVAAIAYFCFRNGLHNIDWLSALLAVIGVVLFHAAGNLLSDVGDFRSGADSREACAIPNLVEHIFEPKQYLCLSAGLFALGIAIGLFLTWRCGWELLIIGGAGFIFTLLYTKSKNHWMSDLNVFVIFGALILIGTGFVVTHSIQWSALLLTPPIGLITLSVLHANNTVDIQTDGAAGLHTVAMALGIKKSARLYIAYQIIPFAWVVICVIFGWLPWTALLCMVSFLIAFGNIRQASTYRTRGREAMMGLDLRSAKLQLIFSLTLSIGLFLAVFLQ